MQLLEQKKWELNIQMLINYMALIESNWLGSSVGRAED